MPSSREKVLNIFNHAGTEPAFWTGHPNGETVPLYAEAWSIAPEREAICTHLRDDCRWIPADGGYRHPEGRPAFDPAYGTRRDTLSAEGGFAHAQSIADIEAYPWPDAAYCDFADIYSEIDRHPDKMVFTGMWSPFFHIAADFFGMENYFIQMYESPDLVQAVTEKIVDFFVAANEKFFSGLGSRADAMFFGNDFGTQQDLLLSPRQFREFVLPSMERLIAVGKKYGKKIMLHSCGSIYRVIPDLIAAGVEVLHPIQAQAAGMSAADLAQYKDSLAFVGGIDAQSFLVNATPEQIEEEVLRVRDILGPNIVISPSHEEILPNVPAANMLAMSRAGRC